jgi:hypothetical protein
MSSQVRLVSASNNAQTMEPISTKLSVINLHKTLWSHFAFGFSMPRFKGRFS